MAESLEGRLKHLRSELEGLKKLYSQEERPVAIDMEIEILQEQISFLGEPACDQKASH